MTIHRQRKYSIIVLDLNKDSQSTQSLEVLEVLLEVNRFPILKLNSSNQLRSVISFSSYSIGFIDNLFLLSSCGQTLVPQGSDGPSPQVPSSPFKIITLPNSFVLKHRIAKRKVLSPSYDLPTARIFLIPCIQG